LAAAANTPGSYQQTCTNVHISGSTLYATCKNRGGGFNPESNLPGFQECIGDIQNLNGNLQCNKGASPPPGSYTQTCRDVYMSGTTLNATCKTSANQWLATSLTMVNQCFGDIANEEGTLRCSRGGPPPGGSHTQSCEDVWIENGVLNARCNDGSAITLSTSWAT
jgi:hypothetical protein